MVEMGAGQNPPVQVVEVSEADRAAWVNNMPNIAKEWADKLEAQGVPAREFLKSYLAGLQARGEKPVRDWASEL
jgi:hypothetical protein